MDKVVIKDLGRLIDGEYPLVTVDQFTADDWYAVKKAWGLVVGDFIEANESGRLDMNIQTALALVACRHAGVANARQLLGSSTIANLEIVTEPEEEADADPPEIPNTNDESDGETDDDKSSSGESSTPFTVNPVYDLRRTGTSD